MNIPITYLNRKRLISKEYATINKSMLGLNPSNLYRIFCLSLYRSNWYNVKMRLKDLAKFTGEKEGALKKFNSDIKGIVSIKEYYLPTAHPIYTIRRNRYNLPDLGTHFITLSKEFTQVDAPIKIKGYYIKLLLIAENSIISLSNAKVGNLLKMNKGTIQLYNVDLQKLGLLQMLSNGVKLTPDNLLLSNDIAKPKLVWNESSQNPLPKITLNSKN